MMLFLNKIRIMNHLKSIAEKIEAGKIFHPPHSIPYLTFLKF
jgi:hypothetical protein